MINCDNVGRERLEGYGPNVGKWDSFKWDIQVNMDELGWRASFRAAWLYDLVGKVLWIWLGPHIVLLPPPPHFPCMLSFCNMFISTPIHTVFHWVTLSYKSLHTIMSQTSNLSIKKYNFDKPSTRYRYWSGVCWCYTHPSALEMWLVINLNNIISSYQYWQYLIIDKFSLITQSGKGKQFSGHQIACVSREHKTLIRKFTSVSSCTKGSRFKLLVLPGTMVTDAPAPHSAGILISTNLFHLQTNRLLAINSRNKPNKTGNDLPLFTVFPIQTLLNTFNSS